MHGRNYLLAIILHKEYNCIIEDRNATYNNNLFRYGDNKILIAPFKRPRGTIARLDYLKSSHEGR